MPFNIAFVQGGTEPVKVIRTTAQSKEELQAAFDGHGSAEDVVDFRSFTGSVAEVLNTLCEISFVETELMDILRKIRNAAR